MIAINYENKAKVDIYLPNRLSYKKSYGSHFGFVQAYPYTLHHAKDNKLLNKVVKQKRPLVVQVSYDERSDANFGETYYLPVYCNYCGKYQHYFTRYDAYPKSKMYYECYSDICKALTKKIDSYREYR